ncbi:IS110 family transposase [Bacillus cereus]|uniref:IS110 family transposase n=1 Tax=Bacillus cereus TaxID=1396 RepID=UPI000BECB3AC|nr:transposase [Bacillus cereus]PEF61861.1 hypothetical protein CON35_23140 [Bacillus cereus]
MYLGMSNSIEVFSKMKLFIGIDVSSECLGTCFLTNELNVLIDESYPNDTNDASNLNSKILILNKIYGFSHIVIGMESTSMYSCHSATFFQLDQELQEVQALTTIEDPHKIKQCTQMFDKDKTAPMDGFMIADYLRMQRFINSPIREEKYMALQRLARVRYQMSQ